MPKSVPTAQASEVDTTAGGRSEPFRAELLSADRLAERAERLAAEQRWAVHARRPTPLLALVRAAEGDITGQYAMLAQAAREQRAVSPAGEWLLDNHYLVEEQIHLVKDDLPSDYGVELPRLEAGPFVDHPRLYEAMVALISHTDARIEEDYLLRFVGGFQEASSLTMGEVWAVPIMLRIGLAENVRRLGDRVVRAQADEHDADDWANRLLEAAEVDAGGLGEHLAQLDRERPTSDPAFITRLAQRLGGNDVAMEAVDAWVEARLRRSGISLEEAALSLQQEQAANQVSIANSITSIRFLDAYDWRMFFERTSLVEQILREDPADVYGRMDFRSRDRYRHALESMARRCPLSEIELAEATVSWALSALQEDASDPVRGHIGHYLISQGRYEFERSVGYRMHGRERVYRGPLSYRGLIYWGSLATLTLLLTLTLGAFATAGGLAGGWTLVLMAIAIIPLSDLAMNVVNRLAAWLWPPRRLPRLDWRKPIASTHKTLVVVPSLLTSEAGAQALVDALQVTFLANADRHVHFAILGDLKAAQHEHEPGDQAVIQTAMLGVRELNERYGSEYGYRPFHLFLRARRWSESEGVWMGWERKRGALEELNRALRGTTDTSFTHQTGDIDFLHDTTFVVTLDTDTVLPRDGARKLVGTIAHPLNRARYEPDRRRVIRGYGLVQPRVGMSLPAAERSIFAWLYSGVTGVDPYAGAVSDTYQDVFGEGSFTGKGIYEVDVYNAVLEGRFPERTLLSHDLLEGAFLRTALASDIEVLDEYPASYAAHAARLHRWVRGDWQALPWIWPYVPSADGSLAPNTISLLSRWKILDNVRRSLVAPTLLLFIVAGWVLLPSPPWLWPLVALAVVLFPVYFNLADSLVFRPREVDFSSSLGTAWSDLQRDTARGILTLATLPHQAWLMLDASIRAVYRSRVSHRRTLEWETAADAERRLGGSLGDFYRRMGLSSAIGGLLLVPGMVLSPGSALVGLPFLVLWLGAPGIAAYVSRPREVELPPIADAGQRDLRRIARKTWRFFDTFVTAQDHWLAPDNYQEDPLGVVAHRTSPTNMGLQLLTCLTAADLGYVSLSGLVDRVSRTLSTMAGTERFRGHFYNWYDTETLQPLRPGYVSTVDSGNLAGHLVALRAGLLEYAEAPLIGAQTLLGIEDTVRVALEDVNSERDRLAPSAATGELRSVLEELGRRVSLAEPPVNLGGWHSLLRGLAEYAETLLGALAALADSQPLETGPMERVRRATSDVVARVREPLEDIETFARWARVLEELPPELRSCGLEDELCPLVDRVPTLTDLAEGLDQALAALGVIADEPPGASAQECARAGAWAKSVADGIRAARPDCATLLARLRLQADIAREMWEHTDFRMLFDRGRLLFSIGFNTAEGRPDGSYYDMLASEARLASFVAVAKGDVPQEHWFRLGRSITSADGDRALISWSASMFEYLMPLLVMRSWPQTLLGQTYRTVVRRQISYGRQRGVPWGVSESAFNAKDTSLIYQYQAFGVPGLGLKRGLSDDVVVAPYATILTLPVDPHAAIANLAALSHRGAEGYYGYYESIDYTPGRVPAGTERAVVRAYFAHHQGMSLVAIGNALTGDCMQERFHSDPVTQSAELLLQERVPRHVQVVHPHVEEVRFVRSVRELPPPMARSYPLADTPVPATHFLSNGRYSVMVTNAGGGYSRWKGLAVSRYREDVTRDCWGSFIYLRELESGRLWSATHQPTAAEPDDYHVTFSADKAEFRRVDGDIETQTEVIVSPEDDIEVRRVTVVNHGRSSRTVELTSFFEIALTEQAADQAHKAFSNLFVETEVDRDLRALLFSRRPRSAEEERRWGVHVLGCEDDASCDWSFETDRARFLGRLGSTRRPAAFFGLVQPLSGTVGPVLDPVCALRHTVEIGPGGTARVVFATGVAEDRETAVRLAEKYRDIRSAQRAADLAWTAAQIELRDLGITADEAVTFQRLASRLVLTDPYSRLKVKTPVENGLPMAGLWSLGISGDLPILLVRIDRLEDTALVRQALLAHQYWRYSGLVADLVILNTKPTGYADELDARLHLLVRTGHALQLIDKPGGVFIRRADQMHPDVLNLLLSVARAALDGDAGPLVLQLNQRGDRPDPPDPLVATREPDIHPDPPFERPDLLFDNGYGGFDPDTGEYVIVLRGDETTPAPWVNVMAVEDFGTMVSEAGIGTTWAMNSHENRITTWNNDPVTDGSGEMIYLRDEETGEFWSPTPSPIREPQPYVVRHGRGYSLFEHTSHGIAQQMEWFASVDQPVRICRLRLTNVSDRPRELSATQHVEWVLGSSRSRAQQLVVTWYDAESEMLTAHNHFNEDFPGRAAFLACDRPVHSYTGSRTGFIGRNGTPADPVAMHRKALGAETGRFHDTCGAVMTRISLQPGETTEVSFLLGQTDKLEEARRLVSELRAEGAIEAVLRRVDEFWGWMCGAVRVSTPDPALDQLLNGNLLYQVMSCRFWGRTAMYQSSGAFGFRDQLQDVLALLLVRPDLVRGHILEAARHQFEQGDVMHWWQPHSDRGVRTRISDDRHWLALVVAEYLRATGDASVLDESATYVTGPELADGQEDLYLAPGTAERAATVYEHCVTALESGRPVGAHGLPLMGGGDWNDGMNRVGYGGRGESVWLAWFLDVVLRGFAEVCEAKGDHERADAYRVWAGELVGAAEREAWDGSWYRRAYFDDGAPLGSRLAEEANIDAVAQAWSVISGQGDQQRALRAMQSVEEKLVRWEDGLIALLTPPFDRMSHDPGYIMGYVPGVRENGGQYTHAAVWVVLAYLLVGDGDEGLALLDLINPINHSLTKADADLYKVEPYVVAADVYAAPPHVGRGGWTWYTGSASWFYRVALQNLLGLRVVTEAGSAYIVVDPTIPKTWRGYRITYRHGRTVYKIQVANPRGVNRGVAKVELDGVTMPDTRVPAADDGDTHDVLVTMLGG